MAQQKGYGQFCPISRAAEVLAERWTPLVVRELLCGSVRFNDLQRGVPRMSPSLLSRRLKELEYAGIVERKKAEAGRGWEYHLTESGRDLFPIVERMGVWAQRWLRHDLVVDENLDPDLLMWDIRRRVTTGIIEDGRRFVVCFQFLGVPSNRRRYWLVIDKGEADLCIKDPGYEVDLYITAKIATLTEIWLGHVPIARALRDGHLTLDGAPKDIRGFEAWFALSPTAAAGREPPGRSASA
jgi:DNA-binding HxlR family transcriptional regulator